ncbi:hypothetical protein RclHR1_06050014 [Rhizophagus clarus]|uniref:Inner centromere protein ARK-binding domain-containing protein n=1 Tax=Rhizophagus clarus TaxID=94130 RepID=A0A2Z6RQJ0_9GLOM|nr:hypothetical protein RclHR1_06050014 [Rhizophagus clarus]GES88507.1 hypothetical protein RCL_jg5403.t1 [Rhizophagus clarus]
MATVTNKLLKGSESWLAKERQKFEIFSEESFRDFSAECQKESEWLRNYLHNIIKATTIENPKKKENSNQVTFNNNEISDAASICNNTEPTRKVVIKRTPRSKLEKPEIKSLVLAAAAAKKEQEKQEKRIIKAKELEVARQRAKGKNMDLVRKKKINQVQDNGENMLYKKRYGILEQTKIPSNVQLIEQPKQFGGKIHEKTLQLDKKTVFPEDDTCNSSDEEKVKTKHQQQRNGWEQSPELKTALIRQASIDPETIFGKISPLNADEIFRGREYRFRPRSSSADWTGLDALTEEEEFEYKVRMGFYEK